MVKANKRLPSSVSVSKSALDNATSTLKGLPEKPKENWSLREAVAVLQESISAALGKGYSYEEVAKMLSEKGIEISASSLKSYLSAAKRQKGSTSRGRKPKQRSRQSQAGEINVNGSATAASTLNNTKAALNQLMVISDADDVESSPKKTTRRANKTAAPESTTPATRKTAAKAKPTAKATSKTVSRTKAAAKATPSRGRGKNG